MNALSEIKTHFSDVLSKLVDDPTSALGMIRPAGDPKFGDYQANCAMSLGKQLGKSPRDIAADLVAGVSSDTGVSLDAICSNVEIAGPGFINLTLSDDWIKQNLRAAFDDDRLGVAAVANPRNYVVDYSSPNVAKPMHVGHIRSTVIGDAISKVLRFAGHNVISDNHLGDWGTQFGMIIYGYKHFVDMPAFDAAPIKELGRLYKFVRKLMDFHAAKKNLPTVEAELTTLSAKVDELKAAPEADDKKAIKKQKKDLNSAIAKSKSQQEKIGGLKSIIDSIDSSPELSAHAANHPDISNAVLLETAALHAGDETNLSLWQKFLPYCREDIQKIYSRLDISFDHELGESFYHDQLAAVVADLEAKGFTRESDGAICVFLDNHDAPMIVQKRDGAFLYATTDLATIKYRVENWNMDASLYVVDHRQGEHFDKLFDVAKAWGYSDAELKHVSFGTVMGKDNKPYKTRSGDTVGLEGLLDTAESRAAVIAKENNPELTDQRLAEVAAIIGLGGLKYADLSHSRTSDYVFDYDKMLAVRGNTATYLQYAYARVQGIVRKTEADIDAIRKSPVAFEFEQPIERQLAVKLLQFSEAIEEVLVDYRPNILCNYLFETAQLFAKLFDQCSVKDAATESLQTSRLQICDLTARTLKTGLSLLGIRVLDKM
jgi:arginyl-tRNA synthetase